MEKLTESCILDNLKEQKDQNKKRIQELTDQCEEQLYLIEDLESEKIELEAQLEELQEEYEILENELIGVTKDAEKCKRYDEFYEWLKICYPSFFQTTNKLWMEHALDEPKHAL